jgi:hypothetical protein
MTVVILNNFFIVVFQNPAIMKLTDFRGGGGIFPERPGGS